MKYRLHHTIIRMQICAMTNLGRCLHLNSNVRELESVEGSWWRLVVHLKKKNIAKGTTDPRVEFCLPKKQVLTQILIKFQNSKSFDQTLASKS